jgi:cyclopropane fatty-acyl-phospholipid synthase-like methyltransferase
MNNIRRNKMNIYETLQEKLSLNQFPLSAKYDIKWVIENEMGPNSLWLIEYLTEKMNIKKGMGILDLGCGKAMSSIFLAKEYNIQVIAADLWINASENMKRIKEENVEEYVFPINLEAHNLPFAEECFDIIVSADSYQYYGANELYLDYILKYLKPGGQIGVVIPSLKKEYGKNIPKKMKPYWDSDMYCYYTIEWWKRLWGHSEKVKMETADIMPNGYENWLLWDKTLKEAGVLHRSGDVEILEVSENNFTWGRIIGRKI